MGPRCRPDTNAFVTHVSLARLAHFSPTWSPYYQLFVVAIFARMNKSFMNLEVELHIKMSLKRYWKNIWEAHMGPRCRPDTRPFAVRMLV